MSTLHVNTSAGKLARMCNQKFGGRTCTQREAHLDPRPLKNPIRHVCNCWTFFKANWEHPQLHVCRRCRTTEVAK